MTHDDALDRFTLEELLQRHVNMSEYESQVYLALIRSGKQSMKEVSAESGVPKQRVYDIVETLMERGFVELDDSYPKQAYAIEPTRKLGPIQEQIEQAQDRLEELHRSIADTDSPITHLDYQSTIDKYVTQLLDGAENTVFLMSSLERLSQFQSDLQSLEDIQVRLIVSNLDRNDVEDGTISLSNPAIDVANHVRGMVRSEPFVMSVDRRRGFFWPNVSGSGSQAQEAFYITDGELSFILDRFLSDTMWNIAYPVNPTDGRTVPELPAQYFRIRDCLADLEQLIEETPLQSFSIVFEGYDRVLEEQVSGEGVLSGFYNSEFEERAYLELEDVEVNGKPTGTTTIGGWRSEEEDFLAYSIKVRERPNWSAEILDNETRSHIETGLKEIPEKASDAHAVVGFDGYLDYIRELVDERKSARMYEAIDSIDVFGEIFERETSGATIHFEWIEKERLPGGHSVHAGVSYDNVGYDLTAIGHFGHPTHEEFEQLWTDETIISIGQPAESQYLHFDDAKVLFSDPETHDTLNWERLCEYVPVDQMADYLEGTDILSIGGWARTPDVATIWEGIREDVYPRLSDPPSDILMTVNDMHRLRETTLHSDIETLEALDNRIPVTVVMAPEQAKHLNQVLLDASGEQRTLPAIAGDLQRTISVTRVAITAQREAVLAAGGESIRINLPHIEDPAEKGTFEDHFTAGLGLGCIEGLSNAGKLALSSASIGVYQRDQEPGTLDELRAFLEDYEASWTV